MPGGWSLRRCAFRRRTIPVPSIYRHAALSLLGWSGCGDRQRWSGTTPRTFRAGLNSKRKAWQAEDVDLLGFRGPGHPGKDHSVLVLPHEHREARNAIEPEAQR
jgi:hypothetical protein